MFFCHFEYLTIQMLYMKAHDQMHSLVLCFLCRATYIQLKYLPRIIESHFFLDMIFLHSDAPHYHLNFLEMKMVIFLTD